MKNTARILILLLLLMGSLSPTRADESTNSLTRVGDASPTFACTTLEGRRVTLEELRGKVVLVNFFATWCGPCVAEMPHLEKEVWRKFKDQDFAMVALGREHENEALKDFQKKYKLTFPIAGDPKRAIFGRFATQSIPRNYVLDKHGKIVFQSVGFAKPEFEEMIKVIRRELKKQE